MNQVTPQSGYAEVNGLRMYYETHGSGEPLVLLHGGVVGIPMFGSTLPELAESRQVVAVELQGHGRTADIDRPMGFEAMADDVFGMLTQLGIKRTDVLGCSLGGGVALQLAIRHPEVMRKLIIVSAPVKHDGWFPEVQAGFMQLDASTAEPMKHSPLNQIYPDVDWGVLFTKLGLLMRQNYDWSEAASAIQSPTLLVYADADAIHLEHMVEFYALLGGGRRDAGLDGLERSVNQLAILPGRTHYNIITAPMLAAMVNSFLEAPLP